MNRATRSLPTARRATPTYIRAGVAMSLAVGAAKMRILTLDELAEVLRTTKCALYNRALRDPFSIPPTLKIPGAAAKYLFDASVVDKWLADPTAFLPLDARPKKAVGRPRKYPLAAPTITPSGKRRGRPPKAAQAVQQVLASPV